MPRATAWILLGAVSAVVVAGLLWLAQFRYAVALVYPLPPAPDYGLQTVIACGGAAGVLVAFAAGAVRVGRDSRSRGGTVGLGVLSIVGIGVLAAVLALTLPALR